MPLQKGNHCVYDCHYHFVFTVKYRRAVLEEQVVAELVRISGEMEERYEIVMECLGADKNRVHLLCSAHPKLGPGQIARMYRSITARELFKALPKLRKRLWGGEFWTDRYFVETVAQRGSWTALLRYVKNQGQKKQRQKPEDVHLRLLFPEPEP